MKRFISGIALAGLLLGFTSRAQADLTVSLENLTGSNAIAYGQTSATMDILISSNSGDTLSAFGFTLLITPLTGSGNDLQFSGTQSNPWDNGTLGGNYVFAGQSGYQDNPSLFAFWSGPSTTTNMNDTISAGDYSDSSQGYVNVSASPTGAYSYLATVQFSAAVVSETESFQVSLVATSYNPNNVLTYFTDQTFLNSVSYTGTGGLVTINGQPQVTGVPEPTSIITGLVGTVAFAAYGWRSSRRSQRRPAVLPS
jgi:hypothetical protein